MIACAHCGTPCPATYTSGRGAHVQPRRYCSRRCRQAAFKARHPGYDAAYGRAARRAAAGPPVPTRQLWGRP